VNDPASNAPRHPGGNGKDFTGWPWQQGQTGNPQENQPMATEQRAPYPRSADNADNMNLPEGKTCGDCAHCRRCTLMFGHIPEDESCDWSPSRFTPIKEVA